MVLMHMDISVNTNKLSIMYLNIYIHVCEEGGLFLANYKTVASTLYLYKAPFRCIVISF